MGQEDRGPRSIARLMALGFGGVAAVAVVVALALLLIIRDVSELVSGMRHDEHAIREGVELATVVREQRILVADALVDADAAHREAYEAGRARVAASLTDIGPLVPADEAWRLAALAEVSATIHAVFTATAFPAAARGELERARRAHREIEALGRDSGTHADAQARPQDGRMNHAHVHATDATRLGLLVGGGGGLLVVALSVGFTLRLRAAVLRPLVMLADAARRFGRGDLGARVGALGRGELGALGAAFDRMAEELAAREARLLQSERMAAIGQLAAGVAHELNNPIGIIRGYLKTMSPESDVETLREELAILDEEAAQCQRIAEDLLAYARSAELSLEQLSVRPFLAETLRRFAETPAGRAVTLELEVEDASLEVDGARLRQVVLNLLANASQASAPGEPVRLLGRREGEDYVLDVVDRGSGVAEADRERVFEPFFSKRRGGSGLGLSVCLGIVEAHRGRIEVRPAEGGGADFRVRLPLAAARREGAPT